MRPRERREQERQAQRDAWNARTIYLDSIPPAQRSEAAARYDHTKSEVRTMHPDQFLNQAARQLRRQRRIEAMLRGHREQIIQLDLGTLLRRVDQGMLPAHVEMTIAALMQPVTEEEITQQAEQLMRDRRGYIKQRYGV